MIRRPSHLLPCALVLAGVVPAHATAAGDGVSAFLAQSARAWNAGELDTFMHGYEQSPATVYMSAKGAVHGYAAIRAHYAAHYQRGMGRLTFSDLAVRPLGDQYALVRARWHLALKSGAHPSGNFALVLHRSATGWHIIEDDTP